MPRLSMLLKFSPAGFDGEFILSYHLSPPSFSNASINPIAQQYFKMLNVFKECFGQLCIPKV